MNTNKCIIFAVLALIILLLFLGALYNYGTKDTVDITIKSKERYIKGGNTTISYWLVFTEKEVFKNSDTFWYWKFNSSDLQNELEIGQTYKVMVYGWRIPFFSMYRNIVKIK